MEAAGGSACCVVSAMGRGEMPGEELRFGEAPPQGPVSCPLPWLSLFLESDSFLALLALRDSPVSFHSVAL